MHVKLDDYALQPNLAPHILENDLQKLSIKSNK